MRSRIISTLLLWSAIAAIVAFAGRDGCVLIVALVATFTTRELLQMLARLGHAPFARLPLLFAFLIALAPAATLLRQPAAAFLSPANFLALALLVFSVRALFERPAPARAAALASTLFALLLVPFAFSHLTQILLVSEPRPSSGVALVLWLVAVAKLCDTGALLTGLAFGEKRHRMCPTISPKKSWEGAVGGVLVSSAIAALAVAFWPQWFPPRLTPPLAALLAAPLAVLAILSDLLESAIKRRADVKDSGSTIPGIGGLFDLTDSFVLTAPAAAFAFQLLLSYNL
jgi:phosphatidate cytidylyltransferase